MRVRITEHVLTEVSYDVEIPEHVYHESQGESVDDYREDWEEVHREQVRSDVVAVERLIHPA